MSHKRLRITRTDADNLVSNLRGEIGEVVTSWTLMRSLVLQERSERSGDLTNDLADPRLAPLQILAAQLADDIVARLSELSERKVGRLTFFFAAEKLNALHSEVGAFARFIESRRFRQKRNQDISHKELPEQFSDHRHLHIPYSALTRGVAMALRLMKQFDRVALGPASRYLWREMRKMRYQPTAPPKVGYMLLPYHRLSNEERVRIVVEESEAGTAVWSDVPTKVDGRDTFVKACKPWAVLLLRNRLVALDQYPLVALSEIRSEPPAAAQP